MKKLLANPEIAILLVMALNVSALIIIACVQQGRISAREKCFKANPNNSAYCLEEKNLLNYRH